MTVGSCYFLGLKGQGEGIVYLTRSFKIGLPDRICGLCREPWEFAVTWQGKSWRNKTLGLTFILLVPPIDLTQGEVRGQGKTLIQSTGSRELLM